VAGATVKDLSATPAVAVAAKPTATDIMKSIHKEAAEVKPPFLFGALSYMQPADTAAVAATDMSVAAAVAVGDKLMAADESVLAHEARTSA